MKCPKCKNEIPAYYKNHNECGWDGTREVDMDAVLKEGKEVLAGCKAAVEEIFGVKTTTPEQVAAINTLFIWVTKEIWTRKTKN